MAKAIGPNFGNEIFAAGLAGLPFSWDAAGHITFNDAMTGPQMSAVQAVYAAHDPSKADPNAAASAMLAAGLAVTSTGTPALNGTYACASQDQINITSLQVAVTANVFPGFLRDRAGAAHTMTAPQFTSIAEALLAFVVAVNQAKAAALGGGAWVAPAAEVTIP